jgi:hypothetical protein
MQTYNTINADLQHYQCRPATQSTQTYNTINTDLQHNQWRPTAQSMQTYNTINADLQHNQCRPTTQSMQTYNTINADLQHNQCRPTTHSHKNLPHVASTLGMSVLVSVLVPVRYALRPSWNLRVEHVTKEFVLCEVWAQAEETVDHQ